MKTLEVQVSILIERPLSEVAAQFADCQYHATRPVHDGMSFLVYETNPVRSHYQIEVHTFGLKQTDEVVNTVESEFLMKTEFVKGPLEGTIINTHFTPTRGNATRVDLCWSAPLAGYKFMIKPFLIRTLEKKLMRILIEDKRDLEGLRYCHYQAGNN